MMPDPSVRNFKGGSWDLRKRERRERQTAIAFPDRRQLDRRTLTTPYESSDFDLTWVNRNRLDE
jgi:hypothetical protein